jgi:hypothetical protein
MGFGKGALLWLIGVPLPIILLLAVFMHHWPSLSEAFSFLPSETRVVHSNSRTDAHPTLRVPRGFLTLHPSPLSIPWPAECLEGVIKNLGKPRACEEHVMPYGQKIETAQRRQRSNIFGLGPMLHNKLAVDA